MLATETGPVVKLDDKFYKLVDKMDALTLAPPSLKEARSLTVKGPVKFEKGVVIKGDVLVVNGEPLMPSMHCFLACTAAGWRLRHSHLRALGAA